MPGLTPGSATAKEAEIPGVTHDGQLALTTQELKAMATEKLGLQPTFGRPFASLSSPNRWAQIGGAVILLMVLTAIFADMLAPYNPYEISQILQFKPPSTAHWLGTDEFGRDLFTRLIYGARIALFIGLTASLCRRHRWGGPRGDQRLYGRQGRPDPTARHGRVAGLSCC